MEKKHSSYETVLFVDTSLGDEAVAELVSKFTSLIAEHGTITETAEWGKRKLAYPINYRTEGYYTLVKFTAPQEFPAELDRVFHITDGILRSMIVRVDE